MKQKIIVSLIFLLASQVMIYAAPPTVAASNLRLKANSSNGLNITFTKGNGAYRIVVLSETAPVTALPVNGVDYTANATYGTKGTEFTAADGFVVYNGNTAGDEVSLDVTNLKAGVTYYVSVFEFNCTESGMDYLLTPLNGNSVLHNKQTAKATTVAKPAIAKQ